MCGIRILFKHLFVHSILAARKKCLSDIYFYCHWQHVVFFFLWFGPQQHVVFLFFCIVIIWKAICCWWFFETCSTIYAICSIFTETCSKFFSCRKLKIQNSCCSDPNQKNSCCCKFEKKLSISTCCSYFKEHIAYRNNQHDFFLKIHVAK